MFSGNPLLGEQTFRRPDEEAMVHSAMTIQGAVNKSFILLAVTVITAAVTWISFANQPELAMPWMWGGLIAGLAMGLTIAFWHAGAQFISIPYALAEGVFLGAISLIIESQAGMQGIAAQAVVGTFGVLAVMLVLYSLRIIRPTEKFVAVVTSATIAIGIVFLISLVMSYAGFGGLSMVHGNGWLGIGFSVIVIIVAALNLIIDFGMMEYGEHARAPKHMEWFCAWSLLVTLIWLYIEFLRLLSKLRR